MDNGGQVALTEWVPASARSGATLVRPVTGPVEYRALLMRLTGLAFDVLGVPLVEGRPHVENPAAAEAVVNQTLARRLWLEGRAVGKQLHLNFQNRAFTVVGVVKDAHLTGLGEIEPVVFTSAALSDFRLLCAYGAGTARARVGACEAGRSEGDRCGSRRSRNRSNRHSGMPDRRRSRHRSCRRRVAAGQDRASVPYLVEERRREIGIRLALGATKGEVRTALMRACRRPVVMGLALDSTDPDRRGAARRAIRFVAAFDLCELRSGRADPVIGCSRRDRDPLCAVRSALIQRSRCEQSRRSYSSPVFRASSERSERAAAEGGLPRRSIAIGSTDAPWRPAA